MRTAISESVKKAVESALIFQFLFLRLPSVGQSLMSALCVSKKLYSAFHQRMKSNIIREDEPFFALKIVKVNVKVNVFCYHVH